MIQDLREFYAAHGEWTYATFGDATVRGPIGPLKHLAKEAAEAQEHPDDIEEYADCLLLTFDSARRAGISYDQLVEAAWKKLAKCKARSWPKAPGDAPVEHIHEEGEK